MSEVWYFTLQNFFSQYLLCLHTFSVSICLVSCQYRFSENKLLPLLFLSHFVEVANYQFESVCPASIIDHSCS